MTPFWFSFTTILFVLLVVSYLAYQIRQAPTPLEPKPDRKLKEYRSHYVQMAGRTFHYLKCGSSGPHMVLLHGIAANTFTWRFLMPLLEPHFQVTVLDMLGHGKSDKDTSFSYNLDDHPQLIHELLLHLGIHKAFLVGSSMGGAISLWLAKKYPEHYPKIATLSPAVNPKHVKKLNLAALSKIGVIHKIVTKHFVREVVKRVDFDQDLINDETVAAYQAPFLDPDTTKCFFKCTSLLSDKRLPHELCTLKQPVLVLWGEQDKFTPVSFAKELENILTRHELYTHPKAGHHCMEDQPHWTFEKLFAFFHS